MSQSKNSPEDELSFEQALQEIEAITQALESGHLGLEESLRIYERGVGLLRRCYELLRQAETRVEMLLGVDEQGNPITTPFPLKSGDPAANIPNSTPGDGPSAAGDANS